MDNQISNADLETTPVEDDTFILYVPEYYWNSEQIEKIRVMFEREGFDNFNIQPRLVLGKQGLTLESFGLDSVDKEVKHDEA